MTTLSGASRPGDPSKSYPNAESPIKFHKKDWMEIAKRVKDEVEDDDIGMVAAASAYYSLFALFPLLIATVSIYGFFSNPVELEEQLNTVSRFIPAEAAKVISDQLRSIVSNPNSALGFGAIISILVAIWTASSGTKAMMKALNIAYDEEEKRGFIKLNLQAIALTFGAILSIVLAVSLIVVLPVVMDFVGVGEFANATVLLIRWPLLAGLFVFSLAVINRFGPSRRKAKWRWVSVGAVLGTLMILLASAGLALYVTKFGSYNATYGGLSGVIILLLWLFLVSYAVLLSAEVNAEIEHQTMADSTVGPARPLGQRGALKADTIPSMHQTPVDPGRA